jgi:mannosyltransferase
MFDTHLSDRRTRTFVAALVGVGALLRLINLNAELWFDEIVTVINFVHAPFADVVSHYGLANNHVMNSVLTNLVGTWLGTSPWLLRLPAVLFGIAGVYAFWFAASALWGRTAALIGTGLFAVSYHHIYYSQNARGYSALIFFGLVSTGCLLRLVDTHPPKHPWRYLAGYAATVGLGLYAMLLMTFVVAGHGVVLLALRRWRALAALAAGLGLAALLYAPMAGSLVDYYRTHPGDTGYPLLSTAFAQALAPLAPLLLAGAAVTLPLVWRLWRRRPVAAALLLAPIAFNVLVPLLRGQGVYPRSFIYGLPIAYLVLVEALDWARTWRPAFAWLTASLVVAASFVKLAPFYQLPKQGFREALAYVDAQSRPGERRLGLTLGGKAARFYDSRYALIEDIGQLQEATRPERGPAWIVSTFAAEMRGSQPALDAWLHTAASDRAEFPGVIGDGTVHVHYWPGPPSRQWK